jgi:F-type H+-transporting ATPase subunit epsilon
MARKILVEIITPEQVKYRQEADMVVVPGVEGELGIMAGHIPLVTRLEIGEIRIHDGDQLLRYAISGGYVEATSKKAVILAEAAESSAEIDIERALSARKRAEERLKYQNKERFDQVRSEVALQRAINRLRIAENENRQRLDEH